MEATHVIIKPLVTEKTTWHTDTHNAYAFQVDRKATKPQIKDAVEELYGVRVMKVATQNRKGMMRRNKFGFWRAKNMKRAVVTIHPEDRIELF